MPIFVAYRRVSFVPGEGGGLSFSLGVAGI